MVETERVGSRHEQDIWRVLESVPDPEIPILNVVELGVIRFVRQNSGTLRVGITPTYCGCPATEVIRRSVRNALDEAGYAHAVLEEILTPPWSSDWLTSEGRRKLREFGIAPPVMSSRRLVAATVTCPRCGSTSTSEVSEFGSTPCKAHYRCDACLEPFDSFKCL